jgi:hypothetical protein
MQLTSIPTEQTTAITDLFLAALSLGSALYLRRLRRHPGADPWKATLWTWTFGLLGVASTLGAVAHGFTLSPAAHRLFWQPLNLALGLTIALVVIGAIHDGSGPRVARRALPIMIGVGAAFFAATQFVPGTFLVFVMYEAAAMLAALVIYIYILIARRHSLPGAVLMAAGIATTLVAAAVQASRDIELRLGWSFDNNGVFHLVQIAGLLLLVAGLRTALRDPAAP